MGARIAPPFMEATDASRLVCVVVVSYQEYSLTHSHEHEHEHEHDMHMHMHMRSSGERPSGRYKGTGYQSFFVKCPIPPEP